MPFTRTIVRCVLGLLLGLAAMIATNTHAELKAGTQAPMFSAPAALAGNVYTFSLKDALSKGPVVVYFYPKAFTRGCTVEATLFAESMDQFSALQTTVIGVSGDEIDTLKQFSLGPCGSKFSVAADLDRSIMKAYDAALTLMPSMSDRISYVITPDGKILFVHNGMNPDQHVSKTLQALKNWQAQKNK